MGIELPTIEESSRAFNSKISAAKFYFEKIQQIYKPVSGLTKIPDELFYYIDAIVFEFHAASQMLLQIINVKSAVNEPSFKVSWNRNFQEKLKKHNIDLFLWWETFNANPDFHVLEAMRQHISHRGESFLQAEIDETKMIKLLSIPIRFRYVKNKPELLPTGKSIELLDELKSIADLLITSYKELKRI